MFVVSACVSTVGIYAECNALSPEEPRHYNRATSENNLPNVVPCSTLLVKHEHVRLVAPSATGPVCSAKRYAFEKEIIKVRETM